MQVTCSICYNDIEETCNIDSCDHIFCRDCITKWGREKQILVHVVAVNLIL